ncbi:kinase-like domain-containing protein [Trametes meyenii]|nr:kinase-like domain-containing protein [Trametes meyenii]
MAPLRKQSGRYARSTTPLDSGFASVTHSTKLASSRKQLEIASGSSHHPVRENVAQQADSRPTSLSLVPSQGHRPPPLRLREFETTETIGFGGWGAVHVVRVKRSPAHPLDEPSACFALKCVAKHVMRGLNINDRNTDGTEALDKRNAERAVLSALPWNPFIAGLVDAYADVKNVYLTVELGAHGTLLDLIRAVPPLKESEIRFYFANIVLAIQFLHTHGISHCDVKPENLVLDSSGYLLLADFGIAQPLQGTHRWGRMGTREYMSPELIDGDTPMDSLERRLAVDWWSAALCLFEMKAVDQPYECVGRDKLESVLLLAPPPLPAHIPRSPEFKDLVTNMLQAKLEKRLGREDLPVGEDGAHINLYVQHHPFMAPVDWRRLENRAAKAPRVPGIGVEPTSRRHKMPLVEQAKVPALSLKRPSPRFEWLEIKSEKEESPRKKRRLGGEFSMCLPPRGTSSS